MSLIFYEDTSPHEIVTLDMLRQAMAEARPRYPCDETADRPVMGDLRYRSGGAGYVPEHPRSVEFSYPAPAPLRPQPM